MLNEVYEILIDPNRMRITQTIACHGRITTDEICKGLNDIPRAAICEHINVLLNANVLCIVGEENMNDNAEMTLSLNTDELRRHILPRAIADFVTL